jgi:hypothetical protein
MTLYAERSGGPDRYDVWIKTGGEQRYYPAVYGKQKVKAFAKSLGCITKVVIVDEEVIRIKP